MTRVSGPGQDGYGASHRPESGAAVRIIRRMVGEGTVRDMHSRGKRLVVHDTDTPTVPRTGPRLAAGQRLLHARRVILAMKLLGLDKETIDEVCYRTPRDFFGLPVD